MTVIWVWFFPVFLKFRKNLASSDFNHCSVLSTTSLGQTKTSHSKLERLSLMEKKVNVKQGPVSPRGEPFDDDGEVFDYPGLEDESNGSGPVSREAHVALKEGIEMVLKLKLLLVPLE